MPVQVEGERQDQRRRPAVHRIEPQGCVSADEIGCNVKSLSRYPLFRAARQAMRDGRKQRHRGHIDGNGNVEAVG